MTAITDSLGTEFRVGDTVIVTAYGGNVRLTDTGRRAEIVAITPRRNIALRTLGPAHDEPIARGASVRPGYLLVLRRDGAPGYEGNR